MAFMRSTKAVLLVRWLGAFVAFVVSFALVDWLLPLPQHILAATPATGFLSMPAATLFNGAVNASLMLWAAHRSGLRGAGLWMQLAALSFGAQTFQTQIETAYFISAFPLLHANFVLYQLVARGLLASLVFTLAVTAAAGGFAASKPRLPSRLAVTASHALQTGGWLAAVYVGLYFGFGYFVAWQFEAVRLFYGGPAELNSFTNQLTAALMARPEIPAFQYFRGVLWLLCLVPLFAGFAGSRRELAALSFFALALLPTAQLAFPNPLMPAGVSWAHFWEVSISTGIFGALCARFVPHTAREHGSPGAPHEKPQPVP